MLRQVDHQEFETSLHYKSRLCLKTQIKKLEEPRKKALIEHREAEVPCPYLKFRFFVPHKVRE